MHCQCACEQGMSKAMLHGQETYSFEWQKPILIPGGYWCNLPGEKRQSVIKHSPHWDHFQPMFRHGGERLIKWSYRQHVWLQSNWCNNTSFRSSFCTFGGCGWRWRTFEWRTRVCSTQSQVCSTQVDICQGNNSRCLYPYLEIWFSVLTFELRVLFGGEYVSYSRCMCVHVQVQVVQKKDFKVYTCTCMYVSCASEVCTISLAGCVCNFIIKAHAVFICFSLELALLSLISLSSLSLSSLLNYLRAFEAEVCVFWGIYRVLRVLNSTCLVWIL